jgi:hypothetical protein
MERTKRNNIIESTRFAGKLWIEKYSDPNAMSEIPISEKTLDSMAQDLIKWVVDNPKEFSSPRKFFLQMGMTDASLRCYLKRSKSLSYAYEYAKELIGIRRIEMVSYREIDGSMLKSSQGHYEPELREDQERMSRIDKENLVPTTQVVYVPVFGKTDVVPELKESSD